MIYKNNKQIQNDNYLITIKQGRSVCMSGNLRRIEVSTALVLESR